MDRDEIKRRNPRLTDEDIDRWLERRANFKPNPSARPQPQHSPPPGGWQSVMPSQEGQRAMPSPVWIGLIGVALFFIVVFGVMTGQCLHERSPIVECEQRGGTPMGPEGQRWCELDGRPGPTSDRERMLW